jgi:hypothetical protein
MGWEKETKQEKEKRDTGIWPIKRVFFENGEGGRTCVGVLLLLCFFFWVSKTDRNRNQPASSSRNERTTTTTMGSHRAVMVKNETAKERRKGVARDKDK